MFTGLAGAIGGYRPLLLVSGGVAFGLAVVAVLSVGGRIEAVGSTVET